MTELEMLLRDIETLRETVQRDWVDLGTLPLSAEEVAGIKEHIRLCNADLKDLLKRLWEVKSGAQTQL